jgi:membrane associated rhomboid family serine protease
MGEPLAIGNTVLILLTAAVSVVAFSRRELVERFVFDPEYILADKQYYRLITSAFLHVDWWHLALNVFGLLAFGASVESSLGAGPYLVIYATSVLGGNLLSLYLHRHHVYRAYGASGGVLGVTFAYVLMAPDAIIRMMFMPIPMPAWLFAIILLLASFWGIRRGSDNIGHDAHLGGAVFGLLCTALLEPEFVRENPRLFLLLMIIAVGLLAWVIRNPMGLPVRSFFGRDSISGKSRQQPSPHRIENLRLDAILEKISRKGMDSLTEQEKQLLDETSGKLRRRSESKKPDSGLAI